MKWLFVTLQLLTWSTSSHAKVDHVLQCLGREEMEYSLKKEQGALYQLNQMVMSELTTAPPFKLPDTLMKKICAENAPTALYLLEALIVNGESIVEDIHQDRYHKEMLDNNVEQLFTSLPDIFSKFSSTLQGDAPTPDCLEKKVPAFKKFHDDMLVLLEHESFSALKDEKKSMLSILKEARQINKVYESCRLEKQKKNGPQKAKPSEDASSKYPAQRNSTKGL